MVSLPFSLPVCRQLEQIDISFFVNTVGCMKKLTQTEDGRFFVYRFFLDIYIRLNADMTDGPAEMQPMKCDSDYNSDEIFPSTMKFRHVNSNLLDLMKP